MTCDELLAEFPSLASMPLEKVLFMQAVVEQFGIENVRAALALECVEGQNCDSCLSRDICLDRREIMAQKVLAGHANT